jgi:hypothetical protein
MLRSAYISSCGPTSGRGFLGCFPRFDSRVSQWMLAARQLPQGWRSVTSHLTRRALHVTQASFARFRGGSDDIVSACLWGWSRSRLLTLKPARISGLGLHLTSFGQALLGRLGTSYYLRTVDLIFLMKHPSVFSQLRACEFYRTIHGQHRGSTPLSG